VPHQAGTADDDNPPKLRQVFLPAGLDKSPEKAAKRRATPTSAVGHPFFGVARRYAGFI
jgi:hypothetical protein